MKSHPVVLALLLCHIALLCAKDSRADDAEGQHRCLALALYWEARGESDDGLVAVGWAILNRVASPDFPDTPCDVVYQGGERPPCQFSWWCDGKSDKPRDAASWSRAQETAAILLTDPPDDPTGGALYFHSSGIEVPWRVSRTETATIGNHVFYR
tara:strand:- start:209 stop:673 length:465 start_codon:yes stop_codon:yes gene_type:complete